jgi:hypothetical protein
MEHAPHHPGEIVAERHQARLVGHPADCTPTLRHLQGDTAVKRLARQEPAVTIGAIITVLAEAQHVAADHPGVSWRSLLPLAAAVVIRRFVTPA